MRKGELRFLAEKSGAKVLRKVLVGVITEQGGAMRKGEIKGGAYLISVTVRLQNKVR